MNNSITFLTVAITAAITFLLHRAYDPDVWVGVAMAIGVAAGVATTLVAVNAIALRLSKKPPS